MNVNQRQYPRGGEVKPTRRALVQVIKLATSVDLQHEAQRFFNLYDSWVKNEGKRSATLRLKRIYHVVLNRSLGQVPPQYPFLATVRGFPRAVVYLEKYCTSPEGIQAVLSLLGYWRGVRCPGIPDLSTITDAQEGEYPKDLEELFITELPDKWKFDVEGLSPANHHFTTRFGPNGKRLLTSLIELKALMEDSNLIESITKILDLTESEDFVEYWEELQEQVDCDQLPSKANHSRLSVKQELGGKDRIFAMVDYWTQCALLPLHRKLASILGTIREDGTFDQGKAADQVRKWTGETIPLFSYDLTAATDRFPAQLQRAVLEELTGSSEYADAWLDLMTNRGFVFRTKSGIRYAVGQPMGAYSSWPMFALTHHLAVMVAAKQAGIRRPEYVLLGDDIVLRSEALASQYLRIMERLGVKISLSKSVTGKVAEFAKRLFTQGREISAIPVKLLQSTLRDFRLIGVLKERLAAHSYGSFATSSSVQSSLMDFCDRFYPAAIARKARILLAIPSRESEGLGPLLNQVDKIHLQGTILFRDWQLCSTLTRYSYLVRRYSEEISRLSLPVGHIKCANSKKIFFKENSPKFPGLDTGHQDLHPVNQAWLRAIESTQRSHRALGKYWTALTQQGLEAEMPSVNLPDIKDLYPQHQRRLKQEATVLLNSVELFTKFLSVKENSPDLTFKDFLSKNKGRGPTVS